MTKEEFKNIYTMEKRSSEIDVFENGKLIAQMMDLRDIKMGVAPHWMSEEFSEMEIISIIRILERINNFDIALEINQ